MIEINVNHVAIAIHNNTYYFVALVILHRHDFTGLHHLLIEFAIDQKRFFWQRNNGLFSLFPISLVASDETLERFSSFFTQHLILKSLEYFFISHSKYKRSFLRTRFKLFPFGTVSTQGICNFND